MADGKRRDEWKRAARICAVLANCHRDSKKRPTPFKDDDYNPYAEKPKVKKLRGKNSILILKKIFVDRPKRKRKKPCQPQRSEPARRT